jgi:diguanylate cyclase (GGDEF)-like protein
MTAWLWWLAVGVPVALSYPLLPEGSLTAGICFEGLGLVSVAVMAAGIRRRRPPRARIWYLLLAGTLASVLGDLIYDIQANYLGVDAFPGPSDAFYLASYPLTAAALLLIVWSRAAGRDRAGLIDAAIVSTALGLPVWTFLVRPLTEQHDTGLLEQLASLGYPIGDVLLLAMTVRLLTAPARRLPAYWMLVVAQATRLLPDIMFTAGTVLGAPEYHYLDSGWLLTYVLTAAAALHPSMGRLAEPAAPREATLSAPRLTLLTAMSLLAPAVLVVQGFVDSTKIDWSGVATGSTVLFLLVVARMKGLLDRVHRQAGLLAGLAHRDGLTGVPNRRAWDDALDRELAAARRGGEPVMVGILDLDHFKRFNDSHGHQAGDLLLKEAAAAWRAQLRETDLLARYGGEEFGIIITGRDAAEALYAVSRLQTVTPRGQTFSAGLARWTGTETAEDLVRRADEALYRAKAAGRDRVVAAADAGVAR